VTHDDWITHRIPEGHGPYCFPRLAIQGPDPSGTGSHQDKIVRDRAGRFDWIVSFPRGADRPGLEIDDSDGVSVAQIHVFSIGSRGMVTGGDVVNDPAAVAGC